jgi:hypothetical protein
VHVAVGDDAREALRDAGQLDRDVVGGGLCGVVRGLRADGRTSSS